MAPAKKEYVTQDQFKGLESTIGQLVDVVKSLADRPVAEPTPEAVKKEKEIVSASSNNVPVNPEWDARAKEIIGDAVDHCEIFYPRHGGTIFTVVIKNEFSNAPAEYLKMNKVDRRSKEIGNEGIEGVEIWCKLIAQNLRRPQQK